MTSREIYNLIIDHRAPVVTDSRTVAAGDIFFALRGDNFNGNAFAELALQKGALKAIIDDISYKSEDTVIVDDVLSTLQEVASIYRDSLNIPVLAITGTNGKTTTKEIVSSVLSSKFNVHSTKGNLNNHIGVPLTILAAPEDASIMVIEMGANHVGEIADLCRIARPDYGLITNIGKAHLEGFGSLKGVIAAKSELYIHLSENNGKIIYNDNNSILKSIVDELDITSLPYSCPLEKLEILEIADSPSGLSVDFSYGKKHYNISSKLAGMHNAENIHAAIAVGLIFGIEAERIVEKIDAYLPDNNRSQLQKTENNLLICDSYNANPDSMNSALESFFNMEAAQKTLILGDMLELGEFEEDEHRKVIRLLDQRRDINVYLVGPVFGRVAGDSDYKLFDDKKTLIEYLKSYPISDSLILIKGSRGIGLEAIYPYL